MSIGNKKSTSKTLRGGEKMANADVRKHAKTNHVRFWEIADYLGKSEATVTRFFRHEFSDEQKSRLLKVIEEIAENKIARATRAAKA